MRKRERFEEALTAVSLPDRMILELLLDIRELILDIRELITSNTNK